MRKTGTSAGSDARSSAMNPNAAEFVPGQSWASCNIAPVPVALVSRDTQTIDDEQQPKSTGEENGNGLKAAHENGISTSVIASPDGSENQVYEAPEPAKPPVWNGVHNLVISDTQESTSLAYAAPKDTLQGNGTSGVSASDESRSDDGGNNDDDGFTLVTHPRRRRHLGEASVTTRWQGHRRVYKKNMDQREGRPHGQGHSSTTPRVVSVN